MKYGLSAMQKRKTFLKIKKDIPAMEMSGRSQPFVRILNLFLLGILGIVIWNALQPL